MSVIHLKKEEFDKEVLECNVPVLVDFWAEWCVPCQMQGPVIDQAAQEFSGKIKVGKLNVDQEGALAQKYGVMSIPMLVLFKDGKAVKKEVGFHSLEQIRAIIA